MTYIEKPPNWREVLKKDGLLEKLIKSRDLEDLINKAQKDYLYWDSFKYQPMPKDIKPEEAWSMLKVTRVGQYQKTPIKSVGGEYFRFNHVNSLYQKLNFIDTYASGFIKTFSETKPTEQQKNKFIITGLSEEAIATSQIEGANTTRKVAKEMLTTQRSPRTIGEQMIINSYVTMQGLDTWKELDLTSEMLLGIQSGITEKTMDDPKDQGRFRNDKDDIVVHDPITGEIVHTPPKTEEMLKQLNKLIEFANTDEDDSNFIHPVIKATMLHFWLSYLHPFVDGNGRTARAVFYWYLLKKDYWLVQYLPVSRAILQSRKNYDNAFKYSENDDDDLTYFLLFIVESFQKTILKFMEYFEEKTKETERLKKTAERLKGYNARQVALLKYFLKNKNETVDVQTHQTKQGVSRQTAHNDLLNLEKKGILARTVSKRKYVFIPNIKMVEKLLLN